MRDHCNSISVWIVPICTSIYDFKKEKLWSRGQRKYCPDLFTLGHNGKILHDDMTLAELATSGTELKLHIFSFDIVLRNRITLSEKILTLIADDLNRPIDIVKGFLISSGKVTDASRVTLFNHKKAEINRIDNQSFVPGQIIRYLAS